MRTHVTFRHPAEFVGTEEEGGVLAVSGAGWFATVLKGIPGLQLEEELCQEDWGVMCSVQRNQKTFWIGLNAWDVEGVLLAHVHHGSFAWLQRFTTTGKNELKLLLADFHTELTRETAITEIAWYDESELNKPSSVGFPMPIDP